MRATELLRLVGLNINQNKFKSVMTSIGIVVGAATIVLVIGIGRGGQKDVAEQFAELNAGAIDVSYEYEGAEESTGGRFSLGGIGQMFGGKMAGGRMQNGGASAGGKMRSGQTQNGGMTNGNVPDGGMVRGEMPDGGRMSGEKSGSRTDTDGEKDENTLEGETEEETDSIVANRLNQEKLILTESDVEDIERYVQGISGATISYSTKASVEGASLTEAQTYNVAGVKPDYESVSKLTMEEGSFITSEDDETAGRVCVLGATAAKELFGNGQEITGSTVYLDGRTYTVAGVLNQTVTVSAGISPDTSILIPYETGIKYITGEKISPVITVIAEDVNVLDSVIMDVKTILEENYDNAEFTFEDSGSKMQAAQASNRTLTMLLSAMAAIVFLVGGIGIMNVLFVSVKERTNEIGILKAIGTSRCSILMEFLAESAVISCIGGVLGVLVSFAAVPIAEKLEVRIEITAFACLTALGFAVLTGTIFGFYPAWKASRLEPVEALNAE